MKMFNFCETDSFSGWLYCVKFPLAVCESSHCFELGPYPLFNITENHKQLLFVYVGNTLSMFTVPETKTEDLKIYINLHKII